MHVFSNTAVSLDGRIGTPSYEHLRLGSSEDLRRMSLLRAQADAVLVGGRTWRAWCLPLVEDPGVGGRQQPVINAVLTRTGQGPRKGRFFDSERTQPVLLGAPEADLSGFPSGVVTHRCERAPDLAWALGVLEREHGVRRLLVEAGGELIYQLLEVGLLHELYVTLCPLLLGGRGAPSLADGAGFGARDLRRLKLISQEQVGSELYLRYRVLRQGSPRAQSG